MAGRWGLSLELPGLTLRELPAIARAAEQAGYTDGWPGEVGGWDGFTPPTVAAMATERMRVGTGVVNVFTRAPACARAARGRAAGSCPTGASASGSGRRRT